MPNIGFQIPTLTEFILTVSFFLFFVVNPILLSIFIVLKFLFKKFIYKNEDPKKINIYAGTTPFVIIFLFYIFFLIIDRKAWLPLTIFYLVINLILIPLFLISIWVFNKIMKFKIIYKILIIALIILSAYFFFPKNSSKAYCDQNKSIIVSCECAGFNNMEMCYGMSYSCTQTVNENIQPCIKVDSSL